MSRKMFPAEAQLGRALTAMSLVASHINEVKRQHEDQLQLQGTKKLATLEHLFPKTRRTGGSPLRRVR